VLRGKLILKRHRRSSETLLAGWLSSAEARLAEDAVLGRATELEKDRGS
jgi:hypothetical protein